MAVINKQFPYATLRQNAWLGATEFRVPKHLYFETGYRLGAGPDGRGPWVEIRLYDEDRRFIAKGWNMGDLGMPEENKSDSDALVQGSPINQGRNAIINEPLAVSHLRLAARKDALPLPIPRHSGYEITECLKFGLDGSGPWTSVRLIDEDRGLVIAGWVMGDLRENGEPASPTPRVIDRSEDPWKPFTPREPDWKRLYYSLALEVVTAKSHLEAGKSDALRSSLERAVKMIQHTEYKIEIGEEIVSVQTKEMTP